MGQMSGIIEMFNRRGFDYNWALSYILCNLYQKDEPTKASLELYVQTNWVNTV